MVRDEWLGRWFFFIAYLIYVFRNSLPLRDIFPTGAIHGVFIFIAAISLLRQPRNSILAVITGIPIALIYTFGGLLSYAAMVLIFTMSLPIIWAGLLSIVARRDYRFLLVLALIAMIPAVLSLQYLLDEDLFDTTYGRPRLLLGYFHPKEAAIAFAVPMLLAMLMARTAKPVPLFVGCIFLWLVGSRNIAMLIFWAWALRWYGRLAIVVLLTSIPVLTLWLFNSGDWYGTIDNMLSLRLSVWTDVLSATNIFTGIDIWSGDRFSMDNFFLEAFVIAGPVALPLIFAWTVAVGHVLRRTGAFSWTGISFVGLLFISTFDSGIASTGNIMHVLLWSIMLSPLFHSRLVQQSVFTSFKSTGRMTVASASR